MAWTGTNYHYYYYRPISIIIIITWLCGVGSWPYCAVSNDRITAGNELQKSVGGNTCVLRSTVPAFASGGWLKLRRPPSWQSVLRPRFESGTLRMQVWSCTAGAHFLGFLIHHPSVILPSTLYDRRSMSWPCCLRTAVGNPCYAWDRNVARAQIRPSRYDGKALFGGGGVACWSLAMCKPCCRRSTGQAAERCGRR